MLTADVFAHFGGNQSEVARALGLTRSSVNGWGKLVPPLQAARIHALTNGTLIFDPADYAQWNQRPKKARRRKAA
jgi:hypothetical protein